MAPIKNGRLLYTKIPVDFPKPGKELVYDETEIIELDKVALNGGALYKLLYISVDPYLRNRMRDPKIESFMPAFEVGKPIVNFGIAVVLRSEDPAVPAGSYVTGVFPFQRYYVSKDVLFFTMLENKEKLPLSVYLGTAGLTGATAYMGWKEYAHAKPGETVFVTTGAGAVGAMVIQLAKADGLKVVASAGSDDKVGYMKSLGADVAFNYRKTKTEDVLKKEGPIQIYWDNVGGEALDAALVNCSRFARFIMCGMITTYNTGEQYLLKNLNKLYQFEITMNGFIVTTLVPKYPEFYTEIPKRIASGQIKYKEDIMEGLENAAYAIDGIYKGKNTGKLIVAVARE